MKKLAATIALSAILAFSASAMAIEVAKPSSPERYSYGTSSTGGNFYVVGGGMSTVLNNLLPDYFVITAEETGGSTANLTMIENGDIEMGIAMTSAIAGQTAKGAKKIRGLVPLYPSYLTMYALAESGIKTTADLNGKIVGFGSKGMAMDAVFRASFPAMGITPSQIFNDGHAATASAIADGQVDAALLFSLPPFAAITELEASRELNFIPLTPEQQKYLVDTYPFYMPDAIPAGAYKGVKVDTPVVSEWNVLVVSSEVPEDYAYIIAKTLYENNPELVKVYRGLTYVNTENAFKFNCPLHTGVVKYLKEIGIEVPAEFLPPEYKD